MRRASMGAAGLQPNARFANLKVDGGRLGSRRYISRIMWIDHWFLCGYGRHLNPDPSVARRFCLAETSYNYIANRAICTQQTERVSPFSKIEITGKFRTVSRPQALPAMIAGKVSAVKGHQLAGASIRPYPDEYGEWPHD